MDLRAVGVVLAILVLLAALVLPGARRALVSREKAKRKFRGDDCKEGGGVKCGTYYFGNEKDLGYGTGKKGTCNNRLNSKSIAMKGTANIGREIRYRVKDGGKDKYENPQWGPWKNGVVDDECRGPTCQSIDMYGGDTDNGKTGRWEVEYTLGKKVWECRAGKKEKVGQGKPEKEPKK